MSLFFILAALLVVVALVLIVPSTLRQSQHDELDQLETNISIAKDRRAGLQRSFQEDVIDEDTYQAELSALENSLAQDLSATQHERTSSRSAWVVAAAIALFLPIASGALYLHLGTPEGLDSAAMNQQASQTQNQAAGQTPALADLLPNLEKKLEDNPDDRDGWKLLGKSYLTISEFAQAKKALMRAYELESEDPDLLALLAEASAMESGGDLSDQATQYLDRALALDPAHRQSLGLKAIASQQAEQHEEAISLFEALREQVSDNPDAVASINEMIKQSAQALGLVANASQTAPAQSNNTTTVQTEATEAMKSSNASDATDATDATELSDSDAATTSAASDADVSLSVTVSLADQVIDQVNATDTVFIFARASNGPPLPLAVSRHTVAELPITVVLDDSMAMMPTMTLSQFPSVTVGARVSPSGNAIAQPGDWFAEQEDVLPADIDSLSLVINAQK